MDDIAMSEDILTAEQVAELLGCTPATVRRRTNDGLLPAVRFGRDWVWPRQALIEAINDMARLPKRLPDVGTARPAPVVRPKVQRQPKVLRVLPDLSRYQGN
jgi:excisionase family DNA binding protein